MNVRDKAQLKILQEGVDKYIKKLKIEYKTANRIKKMVITNTIKKLREKRK